MSNVTQFPVRDDPRDIMSFANGYIEDLFLGDGWKRLAKILASSPGRTTPLSMMPFVDKIAKSEERPGTYDIAKMVGIAVTAAAHDVLRECAREEKRQKNANVVLLRKRK